MATINIEKEFVEDLIKFKLNRIQGFIKEILEKWNEISPEIFLEKAKNGTLMNAELDAIELRQLLLEQEKLYAKLNAI